MLAIFNALWTLSVTLNGAAAMLGLGAWMLFQRRDIRIAGERGLELPLPFLGKKRLAGS